MRSPSVAVIDQDHAFLDLMHDVLSYEQFQPLRWTGSHGALEFVKRSQPDVVILDSWLESSTDGDRLIQQLRHDPDTCHIPVIVATSDIGFHARSAVTSLAAAVLNKPFDLDDLFRHVEKVLAQPSHCLYYDESGAASQAV